MNVIIKQRTFAPISIHVPPRTHIYIYLSQCLWGLCPDGAELVIDHLPLPTLRPILLQTTTTTMTTGRDLFSLLLGFIDFTPTGSSFSWQNRLLPEAAAVAVAPQSLFNPPLQLLHCSNHAPFSLYCEIPNKIISKERRSSRGVELVFTIKQDLKKSSASIISARRRPRNFCIKR